MTRRCSARAVGLVLALIGGAAGGPARADSTEQVGADLVAVARSSVRPPECGRGSRRHVGRWERAKHPGLGSYCDALARGHAALSTSPEAATGHAAAAEVAWPGHAAPLVLRARADAMNGKCSDAWNGFERARVISPGSLDAPATLHDFAVCAAASGHPIDALAAYRSLVSRAEVLGDRRIEQSILVEAAVLVMGEGTAALPEAIAYLTEARRRGTLPEARDTILAALALALDRAGRTAEAAAVLADSLGASPLEAKRVLKSKQQPSGLPALPAWELDAMIAMLAERTDRDLASTRWDSYVASDAGKSGPFAAHARAHRDSLRRGKRAP